MNSNNNEIVKLSILQKLFGAALINIFFMVIVSFYAIKQMSLIGIEIEEITQLDMPLLVSVTNIEIHQLKQAIYLERALRIIQDLDFNANENKKIKSDFDLVIKKFTRRSQQVNKALIDTRKQVKTDISIVESYEDTKELNFVLDALIKIDEAHKNYEKHALELVSEIQLNQLDYASIYHAIILIEEEEDQLDGTIKNLLKEISQFTAVSLLKAQAHEKTALQNLIVLSLIAIICGLFISYFITKLITRPILELTHLTKEIAKGKIDKKIQKIGSDEVGVLSHSVNHLILTLNKTADQANAITLGDESIEIEPMSDFDRLGIALREMKLQIFSSQASLKRSNALTTGILDTAEDGILSISEKGDILSCNQAACRLFQYSEEALLDLKINMLIPATLNAQQGHYLNKNLVSDIKKSIGSGSEFLALKKSDSQFPIFLRIGEVKQVDSIVFTGFIRDITKEKEYEKNLQKTNYDLALQSELKSQIASITELTQGATKLGPLADSIISSLATMTGSGHGVFYISEKIRNIYKTDKPKLSAEALILLGSYAFKQRKNVTEKIAIGEGLVGQCAKEKKSILLTQAPSDYIQINSGLGEQIPLNILVEPIIFENEVMGVVELASFNEYTQLHQKMLHEVMQTLGVVINSIKNQEMTQNLLKETQAQAEKLKTQQEELKSTNESLQEQTQLLKVSEEELKQQSEELRVSNDELAQKQVSLQKQKDEIEISQKELTVQAKELTLASKYKSEFLANMSHELRTPLNSLLLLSKGLAENKKGNLNLSEVEDAKIIYDGGNSLLSLINDILDLSKVEAGKLSVHIEDLNIKTLINNLQKMFNPIANHRSIDFNTELGDDVPKIIISDRQRVEQILRNLLSNAMKFTEQGSVTLHIDLAKSDTRFVHSDLNAERTIGLSIIDTGIGISSHKIQEIFEAFQQEDGSTSRKFGGTGLGLTIARELTRLLGGEIQLQSKQGEGSCFTLYLPYELTQSALDESLNESTDPIEIIPPKKEKLMEEVNIKADKKPAAQYSAQFIGDDRDNIQSEDKSILIIDDDEMFAKILRDYVTEQGYKCLVAGDGRSGIYLAQQYLPKGILLDLKLPDIDGMQVLEQLKYSFRTRHIPVEIISGHSKEKAEVLQQGAIGLLIKPVSENQLHDVLIKISDISCSEVKTILVIEDDQGNRKATTNLLENRGIEITSVATGEAGCGEILSRDYDCVILDLGLPDMTGFEVLEKVSEDTNSVLPPFIIYTGKEISDDEQKALQKYSSTIVIKGVGSAERLLDDVSLFMHNIESKQIDSKDKIRLLHNEDAMLKDRKLLLVDDDMRNSYALSKKLIEVGFDVEMANNGKDALEILEQDDKFELVLMDIMMPVMDGNEATENIRKIPKFKNLPIIALTAKTMPEDREKCLQAGASEYITKPIDFDKLLSIMRIWLFKRC